MCCIVPSSVAPTAGRRRRPVAVSAIQGDETRPGVHPFRSLLVAISMIDFQLEGYLAGSGRGRAAGRQPWWLAGAGTGACVCVSCTTDTAAVRPGGRPQLVCLCPMPISNKHEPPRDVCESRSSVRRVAESRGSGGRANDRHKSLHHLLSLSHTTSILRPNLQAPYS